MDLKLDGNGDIVIEGSDLVLTEGVESVAQDCDIRLKFFQGEWFLDVRLGVPYYQKILGEKPRLEVVKAIIRDAILTTPGMIGINDLRLEWDGISRTMFVSFNAQSTEGPFTYNKELIL